MRVCVFACLRVCVCVCASCARVAAAAAAAAAVCCLLVSFALPARCQSACATSCVLSQRVLRWRRCWVSPTVSVVRSTSGRDEAAGAESSRPGRSRRHRAFPWQPRCRPRRTALHLRSCDQSAYGQQICTRQHQHQPRLRRRLRSLAACWPWLRAHTSRHARAPALQAGRGARGNALAARWTISIGPTWCPGGVPLHPALAAALTRGRGGACMSDACDVHSEVDVGAPLFDPTYLNAIQFAPHGCRRGGLARAGTASLSDTTAWKP